MGRAKVRPEAQPPPRLYAASCLPLSSLAQAFRGGEAGKTEGRCDPRARRPAIGMDQPRLPSGETAKES